MTVGEKVQYTCSQRLIEAKEVFFSMFGVNKEVFEEIMNTLYAMVYMPVVREGALVGSPARTLFEETFQGFDESMTKDPVTCLRLVLMAGLVKIRTNISLLFVSSVVGAPHQMVTWKFMHRCWRLIKLSLFGPYDDVSDGFFDFSTNIYRN